MFKNILVPTDGSELSDSTVERAISFAKDAGARITFFTPNPTSRRRYTVKAPCSTPPRRSSSAGRRGRGREDPHPLQRRGDRSGDRVER